MAVKHAIRFSHVGLFVTDIEKMVDFYTRVMGFIVTDRGPRPGGEIVFMTLDSEEHHRLVVASGRPDELNFNVINQISFRVDDLATLREVHEAVALEPGVNMLGAVTHGNAVSTYFLDPDGNRIEILCGTPWYVPQPQRIAVDLKLPDDELWASIEHMLKDLPGFRSHAQWQAEIEHRLQTR